MPNMIGIEIIPSNTPSGMNSQNTTIPDSPSIEETFVRMTNAMPVRYPSTAPTWAPRIARPVKMSVVRMPFTGGLPIVIRAGD